MNPKRIFFYIAPVAVVIGLLVYIFWPEDLSDVVSFPYIAHQKPFLDPHLPSPDDLSDKLDEVVFDGLFNLIATPSGIAFEDGLGQLVGIDADQTVTIRLKPTKKWHDSYRATLADGRIDIADAGKAVPFVAEDIAFTLRRIERLKSLSRDYVLVAQALHAFEFEGPDTENAIRFRFKTDRLWTEDEIKEILSFKILPRTAEIAAASFQIGTGPYMSTPPDPTQKDVIRFYRPPSRDAAISEVSLIPFIDNSTFTTELNNARFNVLLNTPFGGLSPILTDDKRFFTKSNISTTFFAILLNTQLLNREQRKAVRQFIDRKALLDRLYKTGTEQQRHIVDYRGRRDNYTDYLNYSVFPSSSYYIEEQILIPPRDNTAADLSALPDSIRIVACANFGFREEYNEIMESLKDEKLFFNKIKTTVIQNEEIAQGNYDGILVAFPGYKSNFLFDLYDVFLRAPDLATYRVDLKLARNEKGEETINPSGVIATNNFARLDARVLSPDQPDVLKLLEYTHGFMSTWHISDKHEYARLVDQTEHELAIGVWLFSLPSLAYFSSQFDPSTIHMYGVASQLSTIEKWKELPKQ